VSSHHEPWLASASTSISLVPRSVVGALER
jgi:hypothetical protein